MGSQTQKLSYHLVAPQSESVGDSQFVYEMVPPMLHPRSVKILGIERVGFKALLIMHLAVLNLFAVKMKMSRWYFLSPNTISMLQHLNWGFICFAKAIYIHLVFDHVDQ